MVIVPADVTWRKVTELLKKLFAEEGMPLVGRT